MTLENVAVDCMTLEASNSASMSRFRVRAFTYLVQGVKA